MTTRLIALAGPPTGNTYVLTEGDASIGRDPSNWLCINDPSVSRRHCVLRMEADSVRITDLESRNGTLVNDVPVREQLLEHGDHLAIGDALFVYLTRDTEPELDAGAVLSDEDTSVPQTTVQLRTDDAHYLQPELPIDSLRDPARAARDLNALIQISGAITSTRGVEPLSRRLLELVGEAVPADRGAILLTSLAGELSTTFTWRRRAADERPLQVSRTIVNRVMQDGMALLSNDILRHDAFSQAESVLASPVRSVLAVPLRRLDKKLGVLYLDKYDPLVQFDEGHLHFVTATAAFAASALESTRLLEWLEEENRRLKAEAGAEHNMVGESPRIREVYQFISRAAPTDSTVLIRGESGTGKELVARAIHRNSDRAQRMFVAINCAALTETLLESELFGHEKGAFTGAIVQKKGKLELAHGGTVFLDEMGEMAPSLQAKLLRVLQERELERVGGTRPIKIDIRLIAATNKDLEEAIRDGSFRQDLYYRLNVLSVTMPPLRERRQDIALLASYFANKYAEKARRRLNGVSPEAQLCLANYSWPGNVRELENAIERAIVLGSSEWLRPEDLPESVLESETGPGAPVTRYHEAVKETKKQIILQSVEQAGGSYTEAAKLLGVHPNYLHRLIRNLNLRSALKKWGPTRDTR